MARFTTTSRGKLDFAINVLLKFYNPVISINRIMTNGTVRASSCLLYTSDAADDLPCLALGGRRILEKKKTHYSTSPYILRSR